MADSDQAANGSNNNGPGNTETGQPGPDVGQLTQLVGAAFLQLLAQGQPAPTHPHAPTPEGSGVGEDRAQGRAPDFLSQLTTALLTTGTQTGAQRTATAASGPSAASAAQHQTGTPLAPQQGAMDPKVNDSLTEAAAGSKALAATVAAFQGLLELLERAIQSAVGGHVPFDRLAIPDFRRHLEAAKAAYLHSAPAPQLLGANVLTPCAFTNSLDISTELGQWIASTNMFTNPTAQPMQLAGAPALPPAGHVPVGILHQLVYALQLDITMMQRLSGALKEIAERKAATVSLLQGSYYAQHCSNSMPRTRSPCNPCRQHTGSPRAPCGFPKSGQGLVACYRSWWQCQRTQTSKTSARKCHS